MRHAPLLELHGVGVADDLPEEFSIEDVLEHLLHLQIEDTAREDGIILPGRVRQQVLLRNKHYSSNSKLGETSISFHFGFPVKVTKRSGVPV